MSWFSVIKSVDDATKIAREYFVEKKTDDIIVYDLLVVAMLSQSMNPNLTLSAFKTQARSTYEQALQPRMQRVAHQSDFILERELKEKGATFDEIDWDEINPFLMSKYDSVLDRLTEIPNASNYKDVLR
tara:strand:- start:102 stop:488 length:387 start_codon:yes stop_codon:yes gene_type:complete